MPIVGPDQSTSQAWPALCSMRLVRLLTMNVAMTLNTYAEVDPDAKRAAVDKVGEAFDIDLDGIFAEADEPALTLTFTVEQLRAMLAEAERREAADA